MTATVTAEAFEGAFKRWYQPLCLFSLRYIASTDDAEDIVQQTFTEVWAKLRAGECIENLKAYLFQAVKHRSLSFAMRDETLVSADRMPDVADDSEEAAIREAEERARLWRTIDALPPARREIFLLSKRDGLKQQEIADRLHLSLKTVENQMGKALKSLREAAIRVYLFFFN